MLPTTRTMHVKDSFGALLRRRWQVAAALLLSTGAALGEPAHTEEPTSNWRQASLHFQRGYELSQTGDFEQAAQHFEAAYALEPAATVLYNLGQAHSASGHPVEALGAFRKCLQSAESDLDGPLRERVLDAMRVAEGRVGRLRVRVSPPSATLLLDGHPLSRAVSSDALEVKAGPHVIASKLEGFEAQLRIVDVAPKRHTNVTVELKPQLLPGLLVLTCPLPDMEVSIDGASKTRRTPLAEPVALAAGQHIVRLSRPGYLDETHHVEVEAGAAVPLSCGAQADPKAHASTIGTLSIESPNAALLDVAVYVDGRRMAPTMRHSPSPQLVLPLPRGRHHLELRRRNHEPWSRAIHLSAGASLALRPSWAPTAAYRQEIDAAARSRRRWATVAWGAGAALGVSSAVLGFTAVRRHGDWLRERQALNRSSPNEPHTLERLRHNQQRALSIQRLNDAAIGLGVIGAGLLGTAAFLQFSGRSTLEASPEARPRAAPQAAFTLLREGAYLQIAGQL